MLRPSTAFLACLLTLTLAPAALADSLPTPAGPILSVEGHPAELDLNDSVFIAPGGDYVEVTWEPLDPPSSGEQLFGQRFSSDGAAQGERFLVDTPSKPMVVSRGELVFEPGVFLDDEVFAIVWVTGEFDFQENFYVRFFQGSGVALTEPVSIGGGTFTDSLNLSALDQERLVMTTTTDDGRLQVGSVEFLVIRSDGTATASGRVGREIPDGYSCDGLFSELGMGLAPTAAGGFQAIFRRVGGRGPQPDCEELPPGIFLRTFDADGEPLGPETKIRDCDFCLFFEAELIRDRGWLLTGRLGPSSIEGRWFNVEGQPLGAPFQVGTRFMDQPFEQEIAQTPDGDTVVAWREGFVPIAQAKLWLRALEAACTPGPTTLCLGGGRFRVEVDWLDFRERQGSGIATPLSAETGYFTFFNGDNVELVVKVLDGQPRNGNFWVFYGALSNVRYRITVTDTERGIQQVYDNPAQTFASTGDTAAFPGDGAAPIQGQDLAPAEIAALLPGIPTDGPGLATAGESTEELSFHGGRFRASTTWRDFLDRSGSGQGTMLTEDTGYFWFFRPENVEVVVKVLDGRAKNGHWWVFYGALTNVEYTLTVEDTETGTANEYFNPLRTFASDGDTTAFPE